MLVIGCGQWARGDDAAGLLVARRLRGLGIEAVEYEGDGLGLLALWEGADFVLLVDTVVTGAEAGTIWEWELPRERPVFQDRASSSHAFGVAEALEVGRALGRLPGGLVLYGIEGKGFTVGTEMSTAADRGVDGVVERVMGRVRKHMVKAT